MKLFKTGIVCGLAIASSAAFSQFIATAAVTPDGGLRMGGYVGGSYFRPFPNPIGSMTPGNLVTIGFFTDPDHFQAVVVGPRDSYYLWNFDLVSGTRLSSTRLAAVVPGGTCPGTGDFDGDLHREFVIVSPGGRTFAYEIERNSGAIAERHVLGFAFSDTFDKVVGVADADSDGDSDLILQSSTTNQICYRYYAGTIRGLASDAVDDGAGNVVAANGTVVGASNYSGEFQIHIRSAATGGMRVWTMSGTARSSNDRVPGWNATWPMIIGTSSEF